MGCPVLPWNSVYSYPHREMGKYATCQNDALILPLRSNLLLFRGRRRIFIFQEIDLRHLHLGEETYQLAWGPRDLLGCELAKLSNPSTFDAVLLCPSLIFDWGASDAELARPFEFRARETKRSEKIWVCLETGTLPTAGSKFVLLPKVSFAFIFYRQELTPRDRAVFQDMQKDALMRRGNLPWPLQRTDT